MITMSWTIKQDGWLAPAYFSPNCKDFDQFLQTVKNKTTVLILFLKEFLQINSTTDFCTLCKRVSRFCIEKFSSHSANKFRRGTLLCFRKFLLLKNHRDKRGGSIKIFRRRFLVSQCRIFSQGNPSVFHYFPISKNFMPMRRISRFSIENLLSHSIKKFRRGTVLCFTKFLVSKKFMDKRGGREGGSITIFCQTILSHGAEQFRRGTLCCVSGSFR